MSATRQRNYESSSLGGVFGQKLYHRIGGQRDVPMKVLFLGLSRTGTLSLKLALERLGYGKVYHMAEAALYPAHVKVWERALDAKYGEGPKLSKADWDGVLFEYQSGGDVPLNEFAEELLKVYPHCKVILTNRDVDAFWKSWSRAITGVAAPRAWYKRISERVIESLVWSSKRRRQALVGRIIMNKFDGEPLDEAKVKRGFHEHYERVRRLVPKERLLEYRIEQGWAPLCEFLGEEIPEDEFPRGNSIDDSDNIVRTIDRMHSITAGAQLVLIAAGVWTAWRWWPWEAKSNAFGFTRQWLRGLLHQ